MESWSGTRPLSTLHAVRKCTSMGAGSPCSATCALAATLASFEKGRYRCPCYDHTKMDSVPLKADVHNITRELLREFEPQVLKKNQTSISQDIEEKILSMYAKGKLDT